MGKLIDKTDIKELEKEYDSLCKKIASSDLSIRKFTELANRRAILSVKVETFRLNNTPSRIKTVKDDYNIKSNIEKLLIV